MVGRVGGSVRWDERVEGEEGADGGGGEGVGAEGEEGVG